jgi:16S rRNA (guanine527-N7)-methyltransferase
MNLTIKEHTVSRETLIRARDLYGQNFDLFETYLNELLWWNKKVNLVSREVSRETLQEHIVHSLLPSAMGLLESVDEWTDAGTGGGLPGLPLAIAEPEIRWYLNDVVIKKIAAVKQMVHKLNLVNASAGSGSIADVQLDSGSGLITKHAFEVKKFLDMVDEKPWNKIIMYKGGKEAEEEVQEIGLPLSCSIHKFEFGKEESFYTGKGLLVIER